MKPYETPISKLLVGGFNPFEKYSSNWIISPGRCENKKYLSCHHPGLHFQLPLFLFSGHFFRGHGADTAGVRMGLPGSGGWVFVPEVGRVEWDPGPQNGRTSMACLVNGDDPKYTYSLGRPLKKTWSPWKKQVAFFFG